MERSIRIGKDFNVRWSINKVVDGERQPYELAGKELVLQYRTPYGELKEATEWKVVGNTIVWTFRGKEQKALGSYELILTENGGKDGMVTVDTRRAFKLVAHSCEETEGSGCDIVIEDVVLESEVAFAPVVTQGSGSYDDTEIKKELAELSEEINTSLNGGETTRVIADFVDKGKFLYENDTLDSAQYNISEYIDILGASKVEMTNLWEASNGILAYVIYDASKRVIFKSAIPTTTGLVNVVLSAKDLPGNSAYIRATENTLHDAEIIVTYIAEEGIKQRIDALEMQDATFSEKIARIEEEISGESVEMVMGKIKNLITDFTTFSAQHLNTSNGELASSTSFTTSAFVKVESNKTYFGGCVDKLYGGYRDASLQEVCFYDENKQFLSAVTSVASFSTPKGAEYIRFSVLSSIAFGERGIDDIAECEIVEGNAPVSVFSKNFIENAVSKSGLYGKKWLLIGDSNTEHNFRASAKYDEFISADTGVIPTNIGKSGAGYRVYQNAEYVFLNIFNQFNSKNPNYQPDFITIMGGSNDILYDWENVGSKNDTTNASVFGMVHILIERIKAVYPTTPFAILTPFPHDYAENTPHIAEFVTELKEFCFDNNIPCLDLQFNSGLRPTESAFNKKYYSCASSPDGDGLHLNYFGQQLIASRIKAFLTEYYG